MMVQAKFSAKHALVLSAREVGKGRKAVGRAAAGRRVKEGKSDNFVQKLDRLVQLTRDQPLRGCSPDAFMP